MISLSHCQDLDSADQLAHFRDRFVLPQGKVNFDGNSLGSLPKQTKERLKQVIDQEWGEDLIASWSQNGWFEAPVRIGNKVAKLLGADDGEVIIADSVSVNILKALCAAVSLNPGRKIMLSESGNFPTDLYLMEGLANFTRSLADAEEVAESKGEGGEGDFKVASSVKESRVQELSGLKKHPSTLLHNKVIAPREVLHHLTDEVAVLLLTQVHYKTAEVKDMQAITKLAHEKGILVIWDLSHSIGSVPVDLHAVNADFAVGCGYKFLNGGPGAPAFLYVAKRHQAKANPILAGWMGHQDPFAFTDEYAPATDVSRFRCGTPPILSMTALESGVDLMLEADLQQLRQKAIQLSRLFMNLMQQECGDYGFQLVSPEEDEKRGGHVSYFHTEGHGIYQAVKKRGIISDYRTPGVLRFGITPLYLRFEDIYAAVQSIKTVMQHREWDREEYRVRSTIT